MSLSIQYQEVPLDAVMTYFGRDFRPPQGQVVDLGWFLDRIKQVVIFKLFVEQPDASAVEQPPDPTGQPRPAVP